MSRILEALEANMWPGLRMKPQPGSRGPPSAPTAAAIAAAEAPQHVASPAANGGTARNELTCNGTAGSKVTGNGAASGEVACNGAASGGADSCAGREAVSQPPSAGSAAEPGSVASAGAAGGEELAAASGSGGGDDFLEGPQILAFRELLGGEGGGTGPEALNAEEAQTNSLRSS